MNQTRKLFQDQGATALIARACILNKWRRQLGALLVDVQPSAVELTITPDGHLMNDRGAIHQAAVCTAADMAASLLADLSIPEECRWITRRASVQYVANSFASIRVVADGDGIDWTDPGEKSIAVRIFNDRGADRSDTVALAELVIEVS